MISATAIGCDRPGGSDRCRRDRDQTDRSQQQLTRSQSSRSESACDRLDRDRIAIRLIAICPVVADRCHCSEDPPNRSQQQSAGSRLWRQPLTVIGQGMINHTRARCNRRQSLRLLSVVVAAIAAGSLLARLWLTTVRIAAIAQTTVECGLAGSNRSRSWWPRSARQLSSGMRSITLERTVPGCNSPDRSLADDDPSLLARSRLGTFVAFAVGCCRSDHDSANSNRPSLARSLPGQ